MEITATIDGKFRIVTEASNRRHLKLKDSDGISTLPTTKIFEQLALMGAQFFRVKDQQLSHYTPTGAPSTSQPHLSPTLRSSIRQETEIPQTSSPPHTNIADEAASTSVDVRYGGAATTVTGLKTREGNRNINKTPIMPHDSPLLRVNTLRSDEGGMQHNELMDLVTKLSDRVVVLETDLTQTKKVYGAAFTKLIKKVKRLEKKDKLNKSRRKLRLVLSVEEGSDSDILALEGPSKQGRKIAQIDEDKGITLVQMGVSTTSTGFTTANEPVTTAGTEISTASPEVKTAGDSVDDIAAESLVYIRRSATMNKDKALRLQEQLDEEERQKIARLRGYSFDEIKSLFEATMKRVNTFTPMESDVDRTVPKIAARSTKRAAEEELGQQNKLDWKNPEGDRYPVDLSKPLRLQGYPGHLTVVANYFFNNDLEYLKSSDPERTYTTSIMKTKAARYEIEGIEDMVPSLWSPAKVGHDKDMLKGVKHWGERDKQWHISQLNKLSKHNVYFTKKIMGVKSVSVKKLHGYGHLEKIVVKRADHQLYKFKEGDFVDLNLNDIEDMMLLAVQHKLLHLTDSDIVALLWLFVCSKEVSSSRNGSRIYSLV
ncbi:hypothetical protein Tco_0387018 [Tanacetum coccineum]